MITEKQIRVGNYYEGTDFSIPRLGIYTPKIGGIIPCTITAYGIYMVSEGKLEFKPIILTEEWVLKFGLIKQDDCPYISDGYWLFEEGEIAFSKLPNGNWNVYRFYSGTPNPPYKIKEFKHVHEFQNIVFVLTDEELKLK